jgi:PAS domain S-box-containing protein
MSGFDFETLGTTLVESVPDLVYVVDLRGRLRWWNDRVVEVIGYDDEELSGKDCFELLPPGQRERAIEAFANAGSFSPDFTMEFDLLTKDGERIPHEFNGGLVELEERTVVVTIARDVSERREREREIRRQRDELATLNSISETVHGVIQAVVDAATREEIETVVCERLSASELYCAVWIGREDPDGGLEPVTGDGVEDDFMEVVMGLDDLEWRRPAEALETGEVRTVQRIPESGLPEAVRAAAESKGIHAGAAVPIVHRETVEGVFCVYSSRADAFSERERAALERLGEVVGFAINAYRTERLLLSDVVTEVTLRATGADTFMGAISRFSDGPVRKEWSTPVDAGDDDYLHYLTIVGVGPERVVELADELATVESVDHVGQDGATEVFEVVTNDSFTSRLLDAGATPTEMVACDGKLTLVVELPADTEARTVVEAAAELYDVELASKREVERPASTAEEFGDAVDDRLTDRQRAALRHAYFGGYFSWPRDATAEEVADRMGLSSPTFHYHIRNAERSFVEAYLDALDD